MYETFKCRSVKSVVIFCRFVLFLVRFEGKFKVYPSVKNYVSVTTMLVTGIDRLVLKLGFVENIRVKKKKAFFTHDPHNVNNFTL